MPGDKTYPNLARVFVGFPLKKLGKRDEHPDCVLLAESLRFLNWILDPANSLPRQILSMYSFVMVPPTWYTTMMDAQKGLRCGDRRELVTRYMEATAAKERTYDITHDPETWGYVFLGVVIGLMLASYFGRHVYIYLNRLRMENMEQYAISSKNIRITPTQYSPVDRYKGVVASRRVVDR